MPRYFIDIHDGIEVIDDRGRDLPGIEDAKVEAIRIAQDLVGRPEMLSEAGGAVVLTIRDGPDNYLCTIRLVFTIESR